MNDAGRVLSAVRVYLIVFAGAGLPFGLYSALVSGSASRGVESGAIFGLAFSVVIGTAAVLGHRGRRGRISPRQELAIRLDADADSVREYAVQVLCEVSSRPASLSGEGRRVEARTPTSWRSWGEALAVELRTAGSATDVVISSRPVVQLTLADYGRGRDNVEAISRGLERQLLTPW
jgi:hypothetical protein